MKRENAIICNKMRKRIISKKDEYSEIKKEFKTQMQPPNHQSAKMEVKAV